MSKIKGWYVIALLSSCLFITNCHKQENEEIEDIDLQLDGEVVFLDGNQLKSGNINSLDQAVSHGNTNTIYPKWSNDGTKFAYISTHYDGDSSYYFLKIVDYHSDNLTEWIIGNTRYIDIKNQLSWSPDDETIIFLGRNSRQNTIIYLNTLTGDTTQSHFNLDRDNYCSALAWNPIENKIAVNIQDWHISSDNAIWMVEPFENAPVRQFPLGTDMMLGIEHMDWNSNGTKLTYSFDAFGDLFIVNADGTENMEIPDITGVSPCWSDDGNYIMYTGISGLDGSTLIPAIFVTDINGTFNKLLLKYGKHADWY